jgi:hypothetical protein
MAKWRSSGWASSMPTLSVGANVAAAKLHCKPWADVSNPGVKLHGAGFIVTPDEAAALAAPTSSSPTATDAT